ncbi:MAG: HEAT repeat domain-containing protein [Saprospiraceae bacterium]|nr:HEAT repeat domain-containing protein [Candidatus Vicinibacter affinis]
MTLVDLFRDKDRKTKEKTETISKWLLDGFLATDELCVFAKNSKDSVKATCIEALEYATKINPNIADENVFSFVSKTLTDTAPRVKWESARVIGNTAHLFPEILATAIKNLLINSRYDGTVVRWSAAYALGEILKLKQNIIRCFLRKLKNVHEEEKQHP